MKLVRTPELSRAAKHSWAAPGEGKAADKALMLCQVAATQSQLILAAGMGTWDCATLPNSALTSKLEESTGPSHTCPLFKERPKVLLSNSVTRDKSITLTIRVCFQEWEGSDFWCRWKSASPQSTMIALSHNYFLVSIISHANPIRAKI